MRTGLVAVAASIAVLIVGGGNAAPAAGAVRLTPSAAVPGTVVEVTGSGLSGHRVKVSVGGKQARVKTLSQGADKLFLEEVYGVDRHAYEAYVYRRGKLEKFDL